MQKLILVCTLILLSLSSYAGLGENDGDTTSVRVSFNGVFPEIFDEPAREKDAKETVVAFGAIQGVIEKIENKGFRYIVLVDKEGKRHKLLWLYNFRGSEFLTRHNHKLEGQEVTIEFQTLRCYMPKEQIYVMLPQMKGLAVID